MPQRRNEKLSRSLQSNWLGDVGGRGAAHRDDIANELYSLWSIRMLSERHGGCGGFWQTFKVPYSEEWNICSLCILIKRSKEDFYKRR